jgi:hypothetical protein
MEASTCNIVTIYPKLLSMSMIYTNYSAEGQTTGILNAQQLKKYPGGGWRHVEWLGPHIASIQR